MPTAHYDSATDSITRTADARGPEVDRAALAAMHDDSRSPAERDNPRKQVGAKPVEPTTWEQLAKYLPDVELIYDQITDHIKLENRAARVVDLVGKGDHSLNEQELRELQNIIQASKNDGSMEKLIKKINDQLKENGSSAELSVARMPCAKKLERDRIGQTYLVETFQGVIAMEGGRNQTFTVERKS